MKKILTEVDGEGLVSLLGENVLLMCANYFYTGKLIGVNDNEVLIEAPSIVYQTGAWNAEKFADIQRMHAKQWYVRIDMIESYGISK